MNGDNAISAVGRIIDAFIPASEFAGSKDGYIYFAGIKGLGYYLDNDSLNGAINQSNPIELQINHHKLLRQTPEELLEEAESQAKASSETVITLDNNGASKAAHALIKAYQLNQLQRSKYADLPEKYMASEVDLYDALTAIQSLAANTTLYENLTIVSGPNEISAANVMIQCLAHENLDVVTAALETWNELVDSNIINLEENQDQQQSSLARTNICILASYYLNHQGIELLCASLSRLEFQDMERYGNNLKFDSDMYKRGMEGILSLLETLLELDHSGDLRNSSGKKQSVYISVVSRLWSSSPTLLTCLLERVGGQGRNRESLTVDMDALTHSAAEILATVMQNDDTSLYCGDKFIQMPTLKAVEEDSKQPPLKKLKANRKNVAVDGVEMLLQAVAIFRTRDPLTASECEYCENCLDAIAASLLQGGTRIVSHFLKLEGLELMLRLTRSKFHAGHGALRVINFCLSGSTKDRQHTVIEDACAQLVDSGGLKLIFPIIMGKAASIPIPAKCTDAGQDLKNISSPKKIKRIKNAKKEWRNQVESNSLFCLYALTRFLKDSSPFDSKTRLLAKFVEGDCEKCDRLIELFLQYDAKMRISETKYLQSSRADIAEEEGLDIELAAFHARLGGGGDLCHRIGAILAFACTESKRCHTHILGQLQVNNSGISVVKMAIEEFASVLEEGEQKYQLNSYIDKI